MLHQVLALIKSALKLNNKYPPLPMGNMGRMTVIDIENYFSGMLRGSDCCPCVEAGNNLQRRSVVGSKEAQLDAIKKIIPN